jgi:aspartate carbamoyltransferase
MPRSFHEFTDLSVEEQRQIYDLAKQIKSTDPNDQTCRINDPDHLVYLVFFEDSTRTKESFRNAGLFHRMTVTDFDIKNSSLNKNETISDTFKMLSGYSQKAVTFIVRSKTEGLTKYLDQVLPSKTSSCIVARSSAALFLPEINFVNAGDGMHEHPSQELLDQYTFLEYYDRWPVKDKFHFALIGDLKHSRTVHSKCEGLKIFLDKQRRIQVDLIAPFELEMPDNYVQDMEALGISVRKFKSLAEYIDNGDSADILYFTRLQTERIGDIGTKSVEELRQAITFKIEWIKRIPSTSKFYHPLPRFGSNPEIPFEIDSTSFNGYDEQSRNGYFVRIALLKILNDLPDGEKGKGLSSQAKCGNKNCVVNVEKRAILVDCVESNERFCSFCHQ